MAFPVPAAGTFQIPPRDVASKINSFQAGNIWDWGDPASSNAELIANFTEDGYGAGIRPWKGYWDGSPFGYFAFPGVYELNFTCNYRRMLFNAGDIVDAFGANMPTGFLAKGLKIRYLGNVRKLGISQEVTLFELIWNSQLVVRSEINPSTTIGYTSSPTAIIPYVTDAVGIFTALGELGFSVTLVGIDNPLYAYVHVELGSFHILGDYITWSTSLALAVEEIDGVPTATLTDGNNGFDDIANFSISYVDTDGTIVTIPVTNIISRTAGQVVFTFPSGTPFSDPIIVGGTFINGIQYSGTVNLGYLARVIADASGIYELRASQTHDTLYDRNTPGATINVKIPDPFLKTGFLP